MFRTTARHREGLVPLSETTTALDAWGRMIQHPTVDSTQQHHALGEITWVNGEVSSTKFAYPQKLMYVYAGSGGLTVGLTAQAPPQDTDHDELLIAAAVAAGGTEIGLTVSSLTIAANEYAGGLVQTNLGTGVGQTARIKSHSAVATADTTWTLTLDEPIRVLTGTSTGHEATVSPNLAKGCIITPTTPTSYIHGVAQVAIAASSYGWITVEGYIGVKTYGTVAVGNIVVAASTGAGSVMAQGADVLQALGTVVMLGATTQTSTILLGHG